MGKGFQRTNHRATQPIPRVIDNTEAMQIKQHVIDSKHSPKKPSDQPNGAGTFAPRGNTGFGMPGAAHAS